VVLPFSTSPAVSICFRRMTEPFELVEAVGRPDSDDRRQVFPVDLLTPYTLPPTIHTSHPKADTRSGGTDGGRPTRTPRVMDRRTQRLGVLWAGSGRPR
jgi:hypothetical protein